MTDRPNPTDLLDMAAWFRTHPEYLPAVRMDARYPCPAYLLERLAEELKRVETTRPVRAPGYVQP